MRVNYIPRLSLSGMNSHRCQVSNPPPVPCSNPGSRAKTDRNSCTVGCGRTRSRLGPFGGASGLLGECHRHYSGRFDGACLLVYPDRQRPSQCDSQVGSCNCSFGAGTRFTRVRASTLAQSPSDPPPRKLQQLVASPAASMAAGWSEPVPGREPLPRKVLGRRRKDGPAAFTAPCCANSRRCPRCYLVLFPLERREKAK
jgi:hypothetical protein